MTLPYSTSYTLDPTSHLYSCRAILSVEFPCTATGAIDSIWLSPDPVCGVRLNPYSGTDIGTARRVDFTVSAYDWATARATIERIAADCLAQYNQIAAKNQAKLADRPS